VAIRASNFSQTARSQRSAQLVAPILIEPTYPITELAPQLASVAATHTESTAVVSTAHAPAGIQPAYPQSELTKLAPQTGTVAVPHTESNTAVPTAHAPVRIQPAYPQPELTKLAPQPGTVAVPHPESTRSVQPSTEPASTSLSGFGITAQVPWVTPAVHPVVHTQPPPPPHGK
jgi:hypothetical protein